MDAIPRRFSLYCLTFVDAMEPLSVADGRAISTEELGKFDVTVANILAAPIMRLQPIFAYFTRPGRCLVRQAVLSFLVLSLSLIHI